QPVQTSTNALNRIAMTPIDGDKSSVPSGSRKEKWGSSQSDRLNRIALLTAGDDRSYALGLALALIDRGVLVDFIGSDRVNAPELHDNPMLNFLNLRGDQREDATFGTKALRLARYYFRLVKYAVVAEPRIFHI